jgi:tetratricopeptide (TPR) repeat protein
VPRRPSDHVDDPAAVGRRLREARERAGLSQRDLAFEGCTTAYISRIETGNRIPSLQILRELARRLGVSADYLATGQEVAARVDAVEEAELALRFGDPETAREKFAAIAEGDQDSEIRARGRAGLGHIAFEAGNHEVAIEEFKRALELWPALEEDAALADSLGRAYAFTACFEEAIAIFERRLNAAEERKDLMETIRFSVLLANTLTDRGRFSRAEEIIGHALALNEDSTDPITRARLWWTQSRLHVLQNDPERAERYARLALDVLLLTEHSRYSALAFHTLAHIKLDQGKAEEALDLLDQGFPLMLEGGNTYEQAIFRTEQARALVSLERLDEAEQAAREALALFEGHEGDAIRAKVVLGQVHEHRGETEQAIEIYREAVDAPELTSRYKVETYAKLAELLRQSGRSDEALNLLTRALSLQAETALD